MALPWALGTATATVYTLHILHTFKPQSCNLHQTLSNYLRENFYAEKVHGEIHDQCLAFYVQIQPEEQPFWDETQPTSTYRVFSCVQAIIEYLEDR